MVTTTKKTTAKTAPAAKAAETVIEKDETVVETTESVTEAVTAETEQPETVTDPEPEKTVTETVTKTESDTVTICLNFPHNVRFMVPDNSGKMQKVVFNGNGNKLRGEPRGILPVGKYGLTFGVDRAAWEWIAEHHRDNELIKNGFLFAATAATAKAATKERAGLRTGLEPINPKNSHSQPRK